MFTETYTVLYGGILLLICFAIDCIKGRKELKENDADKGILLENMQNNQSDQPIQTLNSEVHLPEIRQNLLKHQPTQTLNVEGIRRNPTEGTNNFKRGVEGMKRFHLQMLMDWGKSVGLLTYANGLTATVFRVGKECVMTAMHVYRDITNETTANGLICNINNMKRVTISFPEDNSVVVFHVEPMLVAGNDTLDYAVFQLKTTSTQPYPPAFQFQMEATLSKDRHVHVIGYGDKHSTDQTYEFNISVISQNSERIERAKAHKDATTVRNALQADLQQRPSNLPKIDTAYVKLSEDGIISLDVHQEQGVSGAPCVNIDNSYPVAGGVVLGGEPNFYFDLQDRDIIPREHRIEYAVSMVSIREDMRQNFPNVEVDVFGLCSETQMETDA